MCGGSYKSRIWKLKTYNSGGGLVKTYLSKPMLVENHRKGKYKPGTQRHFVASALVDSRRPRTLDDLFDELNDWPYWATVRRKDREGKPSRDSWLVQQAGGIRNSIRYHLNGLERDNLVTVVPGTE
jgi:hypothetical protein